MIYTSNKKTRNKMKKTQKRSRNRIKRSRKRSKRSNRLRGGTTDLVKQRRGELKKLRGTMNVLRKEIEGITGKDKQAALNELDYIEEGLDEYGEKPEGGKKNIAVPQGYFPDLTLKKAKAKGKKTWGEWLNIWYEGSTLKTLIDESHPTFLRNIQLGEDLAPPLASDPTSKNTE
jgi:hypothetical protein